MSEPPHSNGARLREFHRALGLASPERPTVPDLPLLTLRRTLIREEVQEVEEEWTRLEARLQAGESIPPADLAPLAHELADLLYVTYGALDALGIDADAVFAEVHRANLSKLGGPRRADGKLLKPEGWQPADVRGVIEGQEVVSGEW
ncbi:hypothetical protein E5F05_19555 [Deinococcus metallilatus]|uniref:HAD superfamily Cof-like phosphohydrolase n=1 Tax=Deinococcus metallilatus TaxID=1211322 RepID=A0AAJ5F1Y0_9DEIO|nr:hypothetical protein [Deinococcus metallilatus]MBB5296381.1 putative HAD superfamily Cof-like phosphohydrolase [Deinococcus metallilatus]QBY09943.1 hypothetical protein E5F05_19555 [Deinococcus metallilatus]RXJ08667.1 hypothetical protein ERJ73_18395 [Deinococcus metallilatus]TLK25141.1 hypothetical protein FCS05_13310 [Deinococcus metallilatus]GMA14706.1 hypothetical protein GCM10025871_10370 [Deinococcus metallilatus]